MTERLTTFENKTDMRITPWKEKEYQGVKYRARMKFGLSKLGGNDEAYYTQREEVQRLNTGVWISEDNWRWLPVEPPKEFFDSFWKLHFSAASRWKLTFVYEGPMHYVANAQYWILASMGLSEYHEGGGRNQALTNFKGTVVFGALDGDKMPEFEPIIPELPSTIDWIHDDADKMRKKRIQDYKAYIEDSVKGWCLTRLPALMKQFEKDIRVHLDAGYGAVDG